MLRRVAALFTCTLAGIVDILRERTFLPREIGIELPQDSLLVSFVLISFETY